MAGSQHIVGPVVFVLVALAPTNTTEGVADRTSCSSDCEVVWSRSMAIRADEVDRRVEDKQSFEAIYLKKLVELSATSQVVVQEDSRLYLSDRETTLKALKRSQTRAFLKYFAHVELQSAENPIAQMAQLCADSLREEAMRQLEQENGLANSTLGDGIAIGPVTEDWLQAEIEDVELEDELPEYIRRSAPAIRAHFELDEEE